MYKQVTAALSFALIVDLLTYLCSSLVVRAITILIMPALLRVISPDQFGRLALINSFIFIGTALLGLGLRQVLAADYFGLADNKQKEMVNLIIFLYLVIAVPCTAGTICYAQQLEPLFFTECTTAIRIAVCYIFIFFFTELTYQWLQYQQRARHLMAIQIGAASTVLIGTYFFVWRCGLGINGVLLAQLIGIAVPACVGAQLYYANNLHKHLPELTAQMCIGYLKRGVPFIQTVLFAWLLAAGDRWMLARMSSLKSVGIYAVADTVSQLFYLLILYPWTAAYLPYMLKQYHTHKTVHTVEQNNSIVMVATVGTLALVIGITALITQPLAQMIVPPHYHEALALMHILLVGQLALLAGYFCSCLVQFYKKGAALAAILGISALTNLLLNAFLIPHYDLSGCAWATAGSYLLYFVLMYRYNAYLLSKAPRSC